MKLETKKAKLIAILIAAVSLVLCVVIVLLTVSSCSSNSPSGTTVKKVIKKKVIIVQEPEVESDTDNGDSNNNFDFDNNFNSDFSGSDINSDIDDTSSDSDNSDMNNTSTDDKTDSSTDTGSDDLGSKYEVELKGETKTPMSDKISFGFWTYDWGQWTSRFGEKYGKETDILTTASIGDIEEAKYCKENGISGWWMPSFGTGSFETDSAVLTENWKRSVLSTAEAYKYAGVWDAIEGFHFDEPMLKISGEQFKNMTKFLAENFPDKRIFPVFSSYEVRGSSTTRELDAIDYENCGYITDLGWDSYDSLDINYYRDMFAQIQKQVGRKDIRYWVFPVTYQKTSAFDEEHMLTHLNILYEVLKEFENPGGIFMYSYGAHGSAPAFEQLTDPNLNYNYNRLLERVVEIGKEVKQMEYKYKSTKN